jgi:Uma2 family endonuclease
VLSTGNAYYPDASVIGGKPDTDPEDALSATNPVVLVEVLSPSTADYDRTDKLRDYQQIPSVRHVVHVAHDVQQIEVWSRTNDGWSKTACGAGDVAHLSAIGCSLDVSDVYRDPLA